MHTLLHNWRSAISSDYWSWSHQSCKTWNKTHSFISNWRHTCYNLQTLENFVWI